MQDPTALVAPPPLAGFVLEAQRWCALMDARDGLAPAAWLGAVHARLVMLYAAATQLPQGHTLADVPDVDTPAAGRRAATVTPMSADARHDLSRAIASRLGPLDPYVDLSDESQGDVISIPCSLAYDLSGITQDLRAGLYTWESDGPAAGLWHARFFFEHSWHRYLSGALRALEAHARAGRTAWPAAPHAGDAMRDV